MPSGKGAFRGLERGGRDNPSSAQVRYQELFVKKMPVTIEKEIEMKPPKNQNMIKTSVYVL